MAQNNEIGSSSNIPDDLALIILSKLPLKSLKRFTCVKKSWLHLFENPSFMSIYRRNFISNCHYGNDSSLLMRTTGLQVEGFPYELIWISGDRFGEMVNLGQLEPPLTDRYLHLVGYGSGIHGIICISAPLAVKESNVILWNPATKESLSIPRSPVNSDLPPFAFNPPPSYYAIVQCGFGYDQVSDDYKLIQCIYFETGGLSNIWEIYSVRSNTWRKLDVNMASLDPYREHAPRQHVYLNGVCHWKAYRERHLVSFNLNSEVVLTTPYPVDNSDNQMYDMLDVMNGSIALISNEKNSICISILGEIGMEESWTKLFTFGPLPCNFKFLSAVGNKGDILYITNDNKLVSYDLSTQMVEEINVEGDMCGSQVMIYKESLHPIRGTNNESFSSLIL